jgi:predicted nuclease of predicted toxin-antitoxin system
MKIVVDESVDFPIIASLRDAGHEILAIVEVLPGTDDQSVLRLANMSSALLLTADKDFGELVFRLNHVHYGVVLIRLAGLGPEQKALLVARVFNEYGPDFAGAFAVISRDSVRIRRS